jgi:hypothetical protein
MTRVPGRPSIYITQICMLWCVILLAEVALLAGWANVVVHREQRMMVTP